MFSVSYAIYRSANDLIDYMGLEDIDSGFNKTCGDNYSRSLLNEFSIVNQSDQDTFSISISVGSLDRNILDKVNCGLVFMDRDETGASKNILEKNIEDKKCIFEGLNPDFDYRIDISVGGTVYESSDIFNPKAGKKYFRDVNVAYDPSTRGDVYKCVDSDPTNNIFEQGYIMIAGKKIYDDCDNTCDNVLEKSCPVHSDNKQTSSGVKFYQCPEGCKNGACIK